MMNTCEKCKRPLAEWLKLGPACEGEGLGDECVGTDTEGCLLKQVARLKKGRSGPEWDRCTAEYKEAWADCPSHIARFEAVASLYYGRFGQMAPGKSDVFEDTSRPENMALFDAWFGHPLALYDAAMRIARLEDREKELVDTLDEHDIEDPEDTRKRKVFS